MSTDYDQDSKNMVMECDTCGDTDSEYGGFRECIEKFKENGWKTFKGDDGQWGNSCPKCFEAWKKKTPKKQEAPIVYPPSDQEARWNDTWKFQNGTILPWSARQKLGIGEKKIEEVETLLETKISRL